MRVLITGITGFVGGHLARHLLASGSHEVFGLATRNGQSQVAGVEFLEADIADRDALARALDSCDADAIVHLAGLSHVGESWQRPGDYLRINFGGTRNLVHLAQGRRVLFASSAEVYGNVDAAQQPIREQQKLDPRSPYAMTKACAEQIALDNDAIVVRSFNSIGPGQSSRFALPSFASQLAAIRRGEQEGVIKVGDLSPKRDFLHIEDAVRGYQVILEQGEAGEIYNLASGRAYSIADALDLLKEVSGVEAKVEVDVDRVRVVDIPLLEGDVSRLEALGWRPSFDLRKALEDLWLATLAEADHR